MPHTDTSSATKVLRSAEDALLEGIRNGDERVFARIVQGWSSVMLRLALVHVHSRAIAEEVVQEAWLRVLRDVERFERRSSLRTWVLGIVVNLARSRARLERRSVALGDDAGRPAMDSARFRPPRRGSGPDTGRSGPSPGRSPRRRFSPARRAA